MVFSTPRWQGIFDFLVLVFAIYLVLRWSREARALRVTLGILALEAGALIARQIHLVITVWMLHAVAVVAAVILIVLFQPELRHALKRLEVVLGRRHQPDPLVQPLGAVVAAAFSLARADRGALIVLSRNDSIGELVTGGVPLGGQVSVEILEAIFRKVSPVHDGATIIDGDRITRVGALLPLSRRDNLPRNWGTRHRAGLGLAERSDAVIVVTSEQRGELTLMHDGDYEPVHAADEIAKRLAALFARHDPTPTPAVVRPGDRLLLLTSVGLAVLIWSATFLVTGDEIRTQSAEIEISGLPSRLEIVDQSTDSAEIRLRGSRWALDSANGRFTVSADVHELGAGSHSVDLVGPTPPLPNGVELEHLSPRQIVIRLAERRTASPPLNERH